jgi:translation elongation factor EF-Tu-like GTPase
MQACPDCRCPLPEGADRCPNCGNQARKGFFGVLSRFFGKSPTDSPPALPAAAKSGTFSLVVEDVFMIAGRGVVVTGRVAGGSIKIGDSVRYQTDTGEAKVCRIAKIEISRKLIDEAKVGDSVGLLLPDLQKSQIKPGITLTPA